MTLHRTGLAERKRQVVRDELSEAALQLIAFQGFDETTIDQMVAAAGVSRRTFFRYFQSKEDVVVALFGELGASICAGLAERPLGEAPPVALRRCLDGVVETLVEHPEKTRRLVALTFGTPALVARFTERQRQWRAELGAELARRAGRDESDLRPQLAAGIALMALEVALGEWIATDAGLPALLDAAFAQAAPALAV